MVKLTLHGYYRSSCSARLRIALDLKDIPYEPKYVNLVDGEQLSHEYGLINPSRSVPTLVIEGSPPWKISQSVAALEYLEEAYPDTTSLLPADTKSRASIRNLVNIIACDIQPPTNLRIMKRAKALGGDPNTWARELMAAGLQAYEAAVSSTAGKYSCGDMITLADVCLAPAMWNAERYGVALNSFPTVCRIYAALSQHVSFQNAHWQKQPDCPEELRCENSGK